MMDDDIALGLDLGKKKKKRKKKKKKKKKQLYLKRNLRSEVRSPTNLVPVKREAHHESSYWQDSSWRFSRLVKKQDTILD